MEETVLSLGEQEVPGKSLHLPLNFDVNLRML